jgi:hypothetical protein
MPRLSEGQSNEPDMPQLEITVARSGEKFVLDRIPMNISFSLSNGA